MRGDIFQGLQLIKISPRNTSGSHRLEVWVHPSTFRFIWLKVTRNTLPHHHFFCSLEFLSDMEEKEKREGEYLLVATAATTALWGGQWQEKTPCLWVAFLNGREDSALLTQFHLQMKTGLSSMPRQMSGIPQVLPTNFCALLDFFLM